MLENFRGFWKWSELLPDKSAIIEASGRSISFGALAAATNQVARGLRAFGLKTGDSVAVFLPNCIEFVEVYLATQQSGLYFTAINHFLAIPEISYVFDNCDARILIVHERYRAEATAALEGFGIASDHILWVGEGAQGRRYEDFKAAYSGTVLEDRGAGQAMIYSSGTTGKPKGIRPPLPSEGPDSVNATRAWTVASFGLEPEKGVHLVNGPLHHSGPSNYAIAALHFGHTIILIDKWDAELALRLIEQYRVTNTMMVPTMFTRILKLPEDVRAQYNLSSLTSLIHAAAPCPAPIKHKMIEWLGPVLYEGYGGTEGAGTVCNSQEWLARPGTVGKPAMGRVLKILDETGIEVPSGQPGVIYLEASLGLPEYYKDPEKTASVRRGNFYTLGDMGYLDEDGWLFLVDRQSDMLISGGVNIYPAEIEAVLQEHPKVHDAAVFGVPNEEWGEEVKAVVQLAAGERESAELADEIIAFAKTKLARYKIPRSLDFISQMPRADNGKLYKRQLRDPYWAGQKSRI